MGDKKESDMMLIGKEKGCPKAIISFLLKKSEKRIPDRKQVALDKSNLPGKAKVAKEEK